MSIFKVYYPINQSTGSPFIEHGPNVNNESGFYFNAQGGNNIGINTGSAAYNVNYGTTAVSNTWQMIEGIIPDPATSNIMSYYVNGTVMKSESTQSGTTITKTLYINGRAGTSSVSYNTYLAELIIYNIGLTTSQRQQVEGYLAHKWGLVPPPPTIPLTIPGCQLWLDGADPAGTGVVPANGTTISTWVDKSGNGKNSTATGTSTYLSGGGINFTGSSYFLNQTFSQNLSQRSIFIVMQETSRSIYSGILTFIPTPNSGSDQSLLTVETSNGLQFFGGDSGYSSVLGNSSLIAKGIYNDNMSVTTGSGYFNGTNSTNVNASSAAGTCSGYTVGGRWQSGSISGSYRLNGVVHEILFYNRPLTNNERQTIEQYLSRKWGIGSSSIPSTHPFYSIRPHLRTFQPIDVPGCQLWLDAMDTTTLTGSNPVTAWRDKSSNAYSFTGTGAVFSNFISSERRSLFFNGSSYLTNNSMSITNPFTVFTVAYQTTSTASTYQRMLNGLSNTNYDYHLFVGCFDSNVATFIANGSSWNDVNANNPPTRSFLTGTLICSTVSVGTITTYVNGITLDTKSGNTLPTFTGLNIGGGYGTLTNVGGQPWNGHISEILVFNSVLTTSQRQQVEGYLAHKWGLSLSVPSTHPFKSFPPASLPFSPRNISGVTLWLDAADQSSLTFSSGSNLSIWKDKSGYENNFSLTSGTTSNINDGGYSVVNFPSGAIMSSANQITFTTSSAFFIVSKLTSLSASTISMVVGFTNINGGDLTFVRYNPSAILNGTAATTTNENDLGNNNYYVNGTFNPSTFGSNYYLNTYSIIGTVSPITSGTSYLTLSSAFSSRYFIGNIAEFLYYPTGLTSSQRQQVEGYLAHKWGLSASLPATHPYKKFPPP
jgi:hypothetical protein